jgi:hypothetical protein
MPSELRSTRGSTPGVIAKGLARRDRNLSLTRYRDRWGAPAFVASMEHSAAQGAGWQTTPWEAVQQAALQALSPGPVSERPAAGDLRRGAGRELATTTFV